MERFFKFFFVSLVPWNVFISVHIFKSALKCKELTVLR